MEAFVKVLKKVHFYLGTLCFSQFICGCRLLVPFVYCLFNKHFYSSFLSKWLLYSRVTTRCPSNPAFSEVDIFRHDTSNPDSLKHNPRLHIDIWSMRLPLSFRKKTWSGMPKWRLSLLTLIRPIHAKPEIIFIYTYSSDKVLFK